MLSPKEQYGLDEYDVDFREEEESSLSERVTFRNRGASGRERQSTRARYSRKRNNKSVSATGWTRRRLRKQPLS